ncbi:MAG: hypothetical protein K2M48_06555 [Clostridiales bacterium]|nr:hypothetical protein [Clostridiales bacterium]
MKRMRNLAEFFKAPNAVMTACFWAAGLILLGGCIASIVLDVWAVGIRIAVILITSLIVVYAAYGTAMLARLPERIRSWTAKHERLSLFVHNYHVRTAVHACGSIIIDLVYATMTFVIGRKTDSGWYTVNATYYFIMALIRLGIIVFGARHAVRDLPKEKFESYETKVYTLTAIALLILNGWLTTTFEVKLTGGSEFAKHSLIVYGTAIYTFYRIILAIAGLIKSHKSESLITRALRAVSTVTALVSVLTFFTTLAATFNELRGVIVANGIVGNIISVFNISMSIFMLVNVARRNKKARTESSDAQNNA